MRRISRLKQVMDYNKRVYIPLDILLSLLEYKENEKTVEELKEELYDIMFELNHMTNIYIYSYVYYKEKFMFTREDLREYIKERE